jgi:hypothetical protein
MVTIYREPIGYEDGWSYEITAAVPHDWASKKFHSISGHGHSGLGTYDSDVTHISLNDTDPEFEKHLAWIVVECADMENKSIGKIDVEIHNLQVQRNALVKKNRGKYGVERIRGE